MFISCIISFIYIVFFIKEHELPSLRGKLIITMFVWKGCGVFFCHSLVSPCEALSGLKCPLNRLISAYFTEISTHRKLEGANPVPEQYMIHSSTDFISSTRAILTCMAY